MNANYACGTQQHIVERRRFMGGMATAGLGMVAGGLDWFAQPSTAAQLKSQQKRIVVFNMHGGLSQLESWDPKHGAPTGGPFRPIDTAVPGIQICELLPHSAQQMKHLCLVRGVNTAEDDHGKGAYLMMHGRRQTPASDFPVLGAVAAKALASPSNALPGHIVITPGGAGGRGNDAAYLGPRFASMSLNGGNPPQHMNRPAAITAESDAARNDFRRKINEQFLSRRRTAVTDAYTYSYEQAQVLMQQRDVFDLSKEPEQEFERYGKHDFGRHCLLARRLLENGVNFVQVSHSNYDTHNENFVFHIEQLGEFDKPFATFIGDLADRGLLETTVVVVLSEFGRTPNINSNFGRDHWSKAWSVCMAGGKLQRGVAFGKTNPNGTEVIDGQVDHGHLFHTYLQAVGVDSASNFDIDGRDMPVADPARQPIKGVLA